MEDAKNGEWLELKSIELQLPQGSAASNVASLTVQANGPRILDQLPTRVIGTDTAKYVVTFEHMCERNVTEHSFWAQNLLAQLLGDASDVITRLSKEAFASYESVKQGLYRNLGRPTGLFGRASVKQTRAMSRT